MTANRTITVYGAYGHTGQFVVSELHRRGWTPVLSGRDPAKLRAAAEVGHGELELRPAAIDFSTALDHALDGAAAVINCAGPFFWTAAPLIEAALRAGIPYLDVAAEIEAVADTLAHYDDRARDAGIVIVPAMAFYGGLGDLLATAATRGWTSADEISIAYGLSSWQPTLGTQNSGQVSRRRRQGRRIVYTNGHMELRTDDAPIVEWHFPAPIGTRKVVAEFTMADSVTIPRHVVTPEIRSYMTMTAVNDVTDPDPSPPIAVDEHRRSAQTFLVDVVARSGATQRRAVASGRDIYAISAPLVVEATERVLGGLVQQTGTLTAGQAFDAEDFLNSLPLDHLSLPSGRANR
jgi:NAD(P)-dependent dehydrogenase (short-subunit alcohol dehydrogenase family)